MKITNDLLKVSPIIFVPSVENQTTALTKIANLAFSLGYITNRDQLLKSFLVCE